MSAAVVIAGTGSGVGKTTLATGLIAALAARGMRVAPFKVGPDYIDPSYHSVAAGRPGRNLDAFLSGPERIAPLFRHGARGAEISIVEGMMGLFDGAHGDDELASSAQIAKLLGAPVLLVVDAGAMARSAAALLHGFASFDPELRVGGVIFNRVGSRGHGELLCQAADAAGVPVLGLLPQVAALEVPERHLGLIPAAERSGHVRRLVAALGGAVAAHVDLEAVRALAQSARPGPGPAWSPEPAASPGAARTRPGSVRIALAQGPAFSFHYRENLELLEAAGAELVAFDPLVDRRLPEGSRALILAGGFPEAYAGALAENRSLMTEVAAFSGPILAECGGLLYLAQSLDGHPMCGRLPFRAAMTDRLTLGYREAVAAGATPWLSAGTSVRGHEFHFSAAERLGEGEAAWRLDTGAEDGIVLGAVQAGYLHLHWAATPEIAAGFVAAAA